MLYALLFPYHETFAPLNVFRYITFRTLVAGLTALTLSLVLGPALIRRLSALQIGQSIRSDGPATHHVKAGTPTMGGTLILFSALLATILLADLGDWYVWMALAVTLGHGCIGFVDDWAKVTRRNSKGIPGRVRLGAECVIAGATVAVFSYTAGHARIAEYLQIPYVSGAGELTVFCGALAAASLGFLWFNAYPAQMFMGDVGSLALGAALGIVALITRQ